MPAVCIPINCLQAYQAVSQFFYSIIFRSRKKHLLGWESVETQEIRFRVFLEEVHHLISHEAQSITLLDAGCGYGAFYKYIMSCNKMYNYTGMDIAQECIEYARTKYEHPQKKYPKFFKANLFEPIEHSSWGIYDICFMSGVLNLNIDSAMYQGANYDLTLFIMKKLLQSARNGIICNFLHEKSLSKDSSFFYHNPDALSSFFEKNGISVQSVRDNYLPNDLTMVLKLKDGIFSKKIDVQNGVIASSKNLSVHIYTDGGCHGNPGIGAWAFICPQMNIEKSGRSSYTTNNKMELTAACSALEWAYSTVSVSSELIIYTDSQYLKKGMTEWITTWRKRGWKNSGGVIVKNKDLWIALIATRDMCKQKGITIIWQWVRGHDGNTHNERCHELVTKQIKNIQDI